MVMTAVMTMVTVMTSLGGPGTEDQDCHNRQGECDTFHDFSPVD